MNCIKHFLKPFHPLESRLANQRDLVKHLCLDIGHQQTPKTYLDVYFRSLIRSCDLLFENSFLQFFLNSFKTRKNINSWCLFNLFLSPKQPRPARPSSEQGHWRSRPNQMGHSFLPVPHLSHLVSIWSASRNILINLDDLAAQILIRTKILILRSYSYFSIWKGISTSSKAS